MDEVSYLGYIVSDDGVKCDPAKLEAVETWPTPTDLASLRSFLGLTSYYRQFIENFSTIAFPMTRLTQKNVKFKWTDECNNAFIQLKDKLLKSPILAYPTRDDKFILDTDASAFGIGGVLSQVQGGTEKVIAYGSKTLSKSQRRYCTTYRELLAAVVFTKQFRHYLYGRPFLLRTDHSSLTWLKNFKEPEGMVARWISTLDTYDFEVQHRKGNLHLNADALSRAPPRKCKRDDCPQCIGKMEDNMPVCPVIETDEMKQSTTNITHPDSEPNTTMTSESNWIEQWGVEKLLELQTEDADIHCIAQHKMSNPVKPDIKSASRDLLLLLQQWDVLKIENGQLYRTWKDTDKEVEINQIVAPSTIRTEIMQQLHNNRIAGHLGREKTLKKIQSRFFWPGMTSDIARWCESCDLCEQKKTGPKKSPMQRNQVSNTLECIAIDILGPLPETDKGNKYILIVGDYFSKWIEGFSIKDHTAQTVADIIVTEFICRYGVPCRIHTDQGREFESELFSEMCSLLGIIKSRTTPYRPQSDGFIERYNRTLGQMLSMFVNENRSDWDDHLPFLMMAYRSSVQESTKCTPNLLMLGREVSLPIDVIVGTPNAEQEERCHVQYIEWIRDALRRAHQCAFENINLSFQKQKKYYDRNAKTKIFEVGELVWKWSIPKAKQKLSLGWTGPYKVVRRFSHVTYEIKSLDGDKSKIVHMDHLKTCKSGRDDSMTDDIDCDDETSLNESDQKFTRSGRETKRPDRFGLWQYEN